VTTTPPGALLVGSFPAGSARDVMESVADVLGDRVAAIPDGDQAGWVFAVWRVIAAMPELEQVDEQEIHERLSMKLPIYAPRAGVAAEDVEFGPFGFAVTAKASYREFVDLRDRGRIEPGARFQVCLPAPITAGCVLQPLDVLVPALERALARELVEIVAAIPAADLAVQFDMAIDVQVEEAARHPDRASQWHRGLSEAWRLDRTVTQIARLAEHVPPGAALGVHLCYGDPEGFHLVEPADTQVVVDFANALHAAVASPLAWVHVPVPRDRDDDAYFAPFDGLQLDPDTRLYLGLLHLADGEEGAARRRAAAAAHLTRSFGVGTECGLGRQRPEDVPALLDLHRRVAGYSAID
jgi:hypothetical protein